MTKLLAAMLILALTVPRAYSSECLAVSDTSRPVSVDALQTAMRVLDSFLVAKQELDTTRAKLSATQMAVSHLKQENAKHDSLDIVNLRIIANQDAQLSKVGMQNTILSANVTSLKMQVRRQSWWLGIAGAVITALTTIVIKK